jgi:hypothetical protein
MHREERAFTVIFQVCSEFDDEYEGDDDGFAWFERFDRELKPRLIAAIFDTVRADPRFEAIVAPRGRDPDHAIEIEVKARRLAP